MLFYANMAIDAIQSNKTTWLDTFIKDKDVKAPLQQFVDAQTTFTKQIVKSAWEVSGLAAQNVASKLFDK